MTDVEDKRLSPCDIHGRSYVRTTHKNKDGEEIPDCISCEASARRDDALGIKGKKK